MAKTTVIMHFFNEQMLIADWIEHHKRLFDDGILIDHHSTDNSVEIANRHKPDNWAIVKSQLINFDAVATDEEVADYEQKIEGWKMSLNVTEYLFCADFKSKLEELIVLHPEVEAFGARAVSLVDKDASQPLESPIWKNRTWGFLNHEPGGPIERHFRWIHRAQRAGYTPGRHDLGLVKLGVPELLHLHLLFSPWPESIERKLQIQNRIPLTDKQKGFGVQHITSANGLEARRKELLSLSYDLLSNPIFKENYEGLLTQASQDLQSLS